MEIVDSQANLDPAAGARTSLKRRGRAGRTEPVSASKNIEIKVFPSWARSRGVGQNTANR